MQLQKLFKSFGRFVGIIALFSVFFFVSAPQAHGFTFDKNTLISDNDFTNSSALSLQGIVNFLQEKGSALADYVTRDTDGNDKTVAKIIHQVSQEFSLSPMLFLVMAQKESSGITSSSMSYAMKNWLLGFGRCDSCSEGDAAPYRGIANQIRSAAEQFREGYLADLHERGYTVSGWGPGISKTTMDGIVVTPTNNATAALYTYNPCVGAYGGGFSRFGCNSAFQKLWEEWNPRTNYPDGALLQNNGVVYLIQDGKRRAFTSRGALLANYNTNDIIGVTTAVIERYSEGAPIQFPNYSLLRSPSGTVYLLVNGKKRGVASSDAFRQLGFHEEEIIDATWRELNYIPDGKSLTVNDKYPTGALLQNNETGAVWYISPRGKRHAVRHRKILNNRYPNKPITQVTPSDITNFKKGASIKLAEGTVVTSKKTSKVFIISNGKRRPFATEADRKAFGYKRRHIITVPHSVLKMHKKGRTLRAASAQ